MKNIFLLHWFKFSLMNWLNKFVDYWIWLVILSKVSPAWQWVFVARTLPRPGSGQGPGGAGEGAGPWGVLILLPSWRQSRMGSRINTVLVQKLHFLTFFVCFNECTVNNSDLDSVTLKAYKVTDCGRNLVFDNGIWNAKHSCFQKGKIMC